MNEECLICGAPLVYLEEEQWMECAVCHKKVESRACCEADAYGEQISACGAPFSECNGSEEGDRHNHAEHDDEHAKVMPDNTQVVE